MTTVAIVYYSGYGHTKTIAEAVREGAGSVEEVEAKLLPADDFEPPDENKQFHGPWKELEAADAIVFGSPTYMGSVSAGLKRFIELSSPLWYQQAWKDKIAAGFTNSGGMSGDKLDTLFDLAAFAGQHSMIWVSQGLFPDAEGTNRIGSWLGLMTQADPGKGPEEAPPEEDRRTAEKFGARLAEAARRWRNGFASS